MILDNKFLQENGFLDESAGKISLADKLEGKTKQYMKIQINQDQRKPLTIRQVVQFLVTLDMDEEVLILHTGTPSIAAPLTEVLVSEGETSPTFISLYTRDEMNKKQE
jgi:hypothetical protein